MAHCAFFPALVLSSLAYAVVVNGESSFGFLSLDCGKPNGYNKTDPATELSYISDSEFIATGETHKISEDFVNSESYAKIYYDVRSFPNGTRNCYSLPVDKGKKYLVRALFVYGNYDGKKYLPKFDLYLGVNLWWPVDILDNYTIYSPEIMVIAPSKIMSVCLVDTGGGTPFITGLELRPLPDTLYKQVTDSQSLVTFSMLNAGGNQTLRYPTDAYDRWWNFYSPSEYAILSTSSTVATTDGYKPPSAIMQTAITTNGTNLHFSWNNTRTAGAARTPLSFNSFLIFMHFSELEVIKANESRKFSISLNGETWYNLVDPAYLETTTVLSSAPKEYDSLAFNISMTLGSTLPPILNAMEVYRIINITELETNNGDVDAIRDIKEKYNVQRNWMGDPCAPRNFTWDGLNCSYSDSRNPRIISLNLSSSGLIGEISDSLSKLTELQKLDLSGNELEGRIPDFFTSLSNLGYLNLSGNKLSGLVPKGILDRSTMGTLVFSVSDNPDLCVDDNACRKSESKSKRKDIVVVITSVCSATVILSIILLVL